MLNRSLTLSVAGVIAMLFGSNASAKATNPVELSFELPEPQVSTNLHSSNSTLARAETPVPAPIQGSISREVPSNSSGQGTSLAPQAPSDSGAQSDLLWSPLDPTPERSAAPPAGVPDASDRQKSDASAFSSGLDVQIVASLPDYWWSQGSNSPLAVAIGAAEGTRTITGEKTLAYSWHLDPGNGADNFGTFSYQHLTAQEIQVVVQQPNTKDKRLAADQANLPELADQRQLQRLQQFHNKLRQQAFAKGVSLSELELVNGLDLANQSEAAALSVWGYIDRLQQMKELIPDDPIEQIREARTWAYWSPEHNRWDAPGLGNTYESIRQDQNRRLQAIQQVLAYQQRHPVAVPQHGENFHNSSSVATEYLNPGVMIPQTSQTSPNFRNDAYGIQTRESTGNLLGNSDFDNGRADRLALAIISFELDGSGSYSAQG